MSTLHITNGDAAIGLLEDFGISEPILPWRDVLHEGPVLPDISLEEQSLSRGDYLIGLG